MKPTASAAQFNTIDSVRGKRDPLDYLFWLVIAGAAFMRFYNLKELSLSNDELSSLIRIRYNSFSEMIRNGVYADGHPAGLQTFYYFWVKFFGDDAFLLRLPFALFGVLTVAMTYQLGKLWFSRLTGILAAAVFAFSPFTIVFTVVARMYSPATLSGLLCVYCWSRFLFYGRDKSRTKWWLGWILFTTICLHLHYFSFLFAGIVGISGLFFIRREYAIKYISGGLISLILFIPEINIFIVQIGRGSIGGWLPEPSKYFLPLFYFELFNRSVFLCALVSLLFIGGIIFSKSKPDYRRFRILCITWFFTLFLIAYGYSILAQPIIMYSTLLFVTPFILLFIFSYIPKFLEGKYKTVLACLFIFLCAFDAIVSAKYFSTKQFGVFREIAMDANNWKVKTGKENIAVVTNVINEEYLKYYFHKMEDPPLVKMYHVETPEEYTELLNLLKTSTTEYFCYIWTNGSHPLEVLGIIRHYYPHLIERKDYFNAESYLFSKHASNGELKTLLFSSVCDYENNKWSNDLTNVTSDIFLSPNHSEKMVYEFGGGFRIPLSEIPVRPYRYVSYLLNIYPKETPDELKLIVTFERKGKPYDYRDVQVTQFNPKINEWNPVIISAPFPSEIEKDDVLAVYLWNSKLKQFYIDDMKLEVHEGVDPYNRPIH